jgi:hypothetical protein
LKPSWLASLKDNGDGASKLGRVYNYKAGTLFPSLLRVFGAGGISKFDSIESGRAR